jgi:flavoprotein
MAEKVKVCKYCGYAEGEVNTTFEIPFKLDVDACDRCAQCSACDSYFTLVFHKPGNRTVELRCQGCGGYTNDRFVKST